MDRWLLPTLREILLQGPGQPETLPELEAGESAWLLATTALADLIRELKQTDGLVLGSVGLDLAAFEGLEAWQFTPDPSSFLALLPAANSEVQACPSAERLHTPSHTIPLLSADPLAAEHFCLVLSRRLWAVMVLSPSTGESETEFLFSFDPSITQRVWAFLRPRVMLTQPHQLQALDCQVSHLLDQPPSDEPTPVLARFSRLLLRRAATLVAKSRLDLATQALSSVLKRVPVQAEATDLDATDTESAESLPEAELLQALAHEIRTPLATIQTLTRSLLRRKDLAAEVIKRLESIERECTDQINRFSLIFRAVELQDTPAPKRPLHLSAVSLSEVLQQSIPHWQQQASRRNLTLSVSMPQELLMVVSDPQMLSQALTGLVDRFTRSLPGGSHIRVQADLAGKQLKLQLQARLTAQTTRHEASPLRALGHLLMLQPETGSVSLSLGVTKALFRALGGKLKVREQDATQGETLTIFLPLGGD